MAGCLPRHGWGWAVKHARVNNDPKDLCLLPPREPNQVLLVDLGMAWWGEGEECPRCLAVLSEALPQWRANRESGRYCHHAGCSWNHLRHRDLVAFRGVLYCNAHWPKGEEPDCPTIACGPAVAPLRRCTAEGVCA